MRTSPLQVGKVTYTDVNIRATPNVEAAAIERDLPIEIDAAVFYSANGQHFATLTVAQKDEQFAYTIEVSAFAPFTIDVVGCAEAYKSAFNPGVVGVNVVRVIYSSVRDMIAGVTARAPWEIACMPTMIIEPRDISLNYEQDGREEILRSQFGMTDEKIDELNQGRSALKASGQKPAAQKSKRRTPSVPAQSK
ncbi:hypothetical protein D7Y53_11960 [Stenotrophomonas maltophilia]|nr:hypothetical protein [Stenotrophomonas maltophilia]PZP76975.1 MAG: hypothetical protein DI592_18215 [Stenotrophomonas maltophilia]